MTSVLLLPGKSPVPTRGQGPGARDQRLLQPLIPGPWPLTPVLRTNPFWVVPANTWRRQSLGTKYHDGLMYNAGRVYIVYVSGMRERVAG